MRFFILLLLMLVACSSSQDSDKYGSIEQEYNGNPPPPLVCRDNEMICYGKCIDIMSNNKNCGWCEEECNLTAGEFCMLYQCRNVKDYGFSISPKGPVPYDVRRDLPRPAPTLGEER